MKKGVLLALICILSLATACTDKSSDNSSDTGIVSGEVSSASDIEASSIFNLGEESTNMTEEDTRLQIGDAVTQPDIEATVSSIEQTGREVCVAIRITNRLTVEHKISLSMQFHVADAERERIAASRIEDMSGADMRAKSLKADETLDAKVYFTLPSDFAPITFIYTYDYMGFRSAHYKIR